MKPLEPLVDRCVSKMGPGEDENEQATMTSARQTTDQDEIRRWVEERQGTPSRVKDSGEGGILRIDFGDRDEALEPIEWEEFVQIFEKNDLSFLHQDKTEDGKLSRFNKFVSRS
jgi:hypothetical protein